MKSHEHKQSHKHSEHHEHHVHHKSKKKPQISIFIKNEIRPEFKNEVKQEENKSDECAKCCDWFRKKF